MFIKWNIYECKKKRSFIHKYILAVYEKIKIDVTNQIMTFSKKKLKGIFHDTSYFILFSLVLLTCAQYISPLGVDIVQILYPRISSLYIACNNIDRVIVLVRWPWPDLALLRPDLSWSGTKNWNYLHGSTDCNYGHSLTICMLIRLYVYCPSVINHYHISTKK